MVPERGPILRPTSRNRVKGIWKRAADPAQNPICRRMRMATGLPYPPQHDDLLPKHQDLRFQRRCGQYDRKPARCHRITVSGRMMEAR